MNDEENKCFFAELLHVFCSVFISLNMLNYITRWLVEGVKFSRNWNTHSFCGSHMCCGLDQLNQIFCRFCLLNDYSTALFVNNTYLVVKWCRSMMVLLCGLSVLDCIMRSMVVLWRHWTVDIAEQIRLQVPPPPPCRTATPFSYRMVVPTTFPKFGTKKPKPTNEVTNEPPIHLDLHLVYTLDRISVLWCVFSQKSYPLFFQLHYSSCNPQFSSFICYQISQFEAFYNEISSCHFLQLIVSRHEQCLFIRSAWETKLVQIRHVLSFIVISFNVWKIKPVCGDDNSVTAQQLHVE